MNQHDLKAPSFLAVWPGRQPGSPMIRYYDIFHPVPVSRSVTMAARHSRVSKALSKLQPGDLRDWSGLYYCVDVQAAPNPHRLTWLIGWESKILKFKADPDLHVDWAAGYISMLRLSKTLLPTGYVELKGNVCTSSGSLESIYIYPCRSFIHYLLLVHMCLKTGKKESDRPMSETLSWVRRPYWKRSSGL